MVCDAKGFACVFSQGSGGTNLQSRQIARRGVSAPLQKEEVRPYYPLAEKDVKGKLALIQELIPLVTHASERCPAIDKLGLATLRHCITDALDYGLMIWGWPSLLVRAKEASPPSAFKTM